MSISAAEVNKLRQMTGAGMMDCKKALSEANGDFEEAIVILRKKGQKISANRSDRTANEGAVIAATTTDGKTGVIVELNCETDFVAKNEDFVKFAHSITNLALEKAPSNLEDLLSLELDGLKITDKLLDYTGKIGEKIEVSKYSVLKGENVVSYIHAGNKIGVLVELSLPKNDSNVSAGKDVAMQIAAMNPVAVDESSVPQSVLDKEMEIGIDLAQQEGKSAEVAEKIAQGKVTRFLKDNTLVNQPFVKDSSKTVKQMLEGVEKGLVVKSFSRVVIGQ